MPDPEDIKAVRDFLQAILKARKNLKIYPSNNPIYTKTVENTYQRLTSMLEYHDEIPFKFTRNEIFYLSEPVFKGVGKDDNLALFFSRDGVKEITIKSGITSEEFQDFLEITASDLDREDIADDVVTLLWSKDFQNITYTVDESMLVEEDEEQYEQEAVKQAKERAADDDDLQRAYAEALRSEETAKEVQLVPITDKDKKALALMKEKATQDRKGKLIDVLYEMLLQATSFYEFHDICSIISRSLEFSVNEKDIKSAIEILWRAKTFDDKSIPGIDIKEELTHIFRTAESPDVIKLIGNMLDADPGIEDNVFQEYVSFLSKDSIPHFMTILGDLKTIRARKSVVNSLVFLGKKDISTLVRGLSDSRWYVVRNIIYILRKIGDPRALSYLLRVSGHSDPRVKKEMIKTLGEIGGQKAAAAVKECLDDPEPFIRAAAARALGSIGSDYAKMALIDKISSKVFLSASFSEKKEIFEVLAKWNDPSVHDFLTKVVKKRAFFKRAKYNEIKAAAANALGLIGSRDSLPALEKLRRSGNTFLSEHAYAAIKRIEYGRQG